MDDIAHFRCPILGGRLLSPDGPQGFVDRTSRNLESTRCIDIEVFRRSTAKVVADAQLQQLLAIR